MPRLVPIAALAALLAGCSDTGGDADAGSDLAPSADATPDTPTAGDTPPADAAPDAAAGLSIPATSGSYELSFGISIEGTGAAGLGAIVITDGFGTVVIDGRTLAAAIHEQQPWEGFGYTLYQALALAEDQWHVLWFYCQGGSLPYVYYESARGGPLVLVEASGTCDESSAPSTVDVSFPALELPIPELLDGFQVSGDDVSIDGASPGWVAVGGRTYDVYVFNRVDCTVDCGTPGWNELHALLWDRERHWLCFGIFYLFEDARPILLEYSFSLPVLLEPFGSTQLVGATWSAH